jgi:hypothetical protein
LLPLPLAGEGWGEGVRRIARIVSLAPLLALASASAQQPGPTRCTLDALAPALSSFTADSATTLQEAVWDIAAGTTATARARPAHCRITGIIGAHLGPPGRTAYGNRFLLRVPQAWNGRFVFQGGGGNNGVVGDALALQKDGRTALEQGFAVIAQDSGHVGREPHFALDAQAYRDFAYDGVRKATAVGKRLIATLAGEPPRRSYFVGCSNGGREALSAAQRLPQEFDGVISGAPGLAVYDQWLQVKHLLRAVSSAAGVPAGERAIDTSGVFSDAQLAAAAAHFRKKCDPLDGLADGFVAHPMACRAEEADFRALACAGGDAAKPDCLSPAQIGVLRAAYDGARDSRGRLIWPGFIPGHIEPVMRTTYLGVAGAPNPLGRVGSFYASVMANFAFMGYGHQGFPRLTGPADELASYPADALGEVARFDFDHDPPRLAPGRSGFHADKIDPKRSDQPNFEAFRRRGGRILLYTGTADPGVQPAGITGFIDRLVAQYGRTEADRMAALFLVPGMLHCRGGEATESFDALGALVEWVEGGPRPARLLARPALGSALFRERPALTRPLCAYPAYARWDGRGEPDRAESFVCTEPEAR